MQNQFKDYSDRYMHYTGNVQYLKTYIFLHEMSKTIIDLVYYVWNAMLEKRFNCTIRGKGATNVSNTEIPTCRIIIMNIK